MESLRHRIHHLEIQLKDEQAREKRFAEFSEIDTIFVSKLSDKDLAGWQAKYPADSPQFIIANHEWQRRLNFEHIRSNRHNAWISLMGVFLGANLASILTFFNHSSTKANALVVQSAEEKI